MLTERQEHAYRVLPAAEENYHSACALLNAKLTPGQRLNRQEHVRHCLKVLNTVREVAGLQALAGPHLLSVSELLQPVGQATPEALRAALAAAEAQPRLFCVVAQYEATTAQAA